MLVICVEASEVTGVSFDRLQPGLIDPALYAIDEDTDLALTT